MAGRTPDHERRETMRRLHQAGMTHAQIARHLGCSAQNVTQILCKEGVGHFRPFPPERCVYGGLRRWLNENRVSISELSRRKYKRVGGNEATYFRDRLKGVRMLTMEDIDFFRALTGLSYEELFKENNAPGAQKN